MSLNEFHDAREAIDVIDSGEVYVAWAPGDATSYRITLLDVVPYAIDALDGLNDLIALVVYVGGSFSERPLVVRRPRRGERPWTVERFARTHGESFAGWWAGVRPLLAALGWTDDAHSSLAYDPYDAVLISHALGRRDDEVRFP